jgi:hypothetical protein
MIFKAITFGALLAVVAGAAAWMAWGGRYLTDEEATDLREMVLRRQFQQIGSHGPQVGQVFFVSIHGQDPDEAFLKRFDGSGWTVRPGSEFVKGTGTFFYLDSFQRHDDESIEIGGGHHIGKKPSWRYTCRLEWHWGRWKAVRDEGVPVYD